MTNIQWTDPARHRAGLPQLRRRRGSRCVARSIHKILHASLPAESFDGPRCEG